MKPLFLNIVKIIGPYVIFIMSVYRSGMDIEILEYFITSRILLKCWRITSGLVWVILYGLSDYCFKSRVNILNVKIFLQVSCEY